jgi:hypothetical protein
MAIGKKKTLVALSTFFHTDAKGVEHFVREGQAVPADHPAAKHAPLLFAENEPADAG